MRRAFLCGDGYEHRRLWIERRLQLLASVCAVDLAAYAVMTNHLHVVIRPRPDRAQQWSARQVAEIWVHIKFAFTSDAGDASQRQVMIDRLADDADFVETWRERFASASWFMKALKEPIARAANKEDDCTGAFWEGRFKSIPLLDQAALVACMAYVDLNPVRAGIAKTPESSRHTSVQHRIQQRKTRLQSQKLHAAGRTTQAHRMLERHGMRLQTGHQIPHLAPERDDQTDTPWLTPLTGILGAGYPQFNLHAYLRLIDVTGRQIRHGKRGAIPADCADILERLQCDPEEWLATMARPKSLLGAVLGHVAAREQEVRRRCCQWLQVRCPLFA
ncbi:MAG: transposase [Planctomycetota bacterium]